VKLPGIAGEINSRKMQVQSLCQHLGLQSEPADRRLYEAEEEFMFSRDEDADEQQAP
jgi:hypothetical protein